MKVKSNGDFVLDVILHCRVCKFHERYYFDGMPLLERGKILSKCRSRARYHTQTTGHAVEVETTHMSVYKPKEVTK